MSKQASKSQEVEFSYEATVIMGFLMGVIAIGGIWFAASFMWEVIKMMGQS